MHESLGSSSGLPSTLTVAQVMAALRHEGHPPSSHITLTLTNRRDHARGRKLIRILFYYWSSAFKNESDALIDSNEDFILAQIKAYKSSLSARRWKWTRGLAALYGTATIHPACVHESGRPLAPGPTHVASLPRHRTAGQSVCLFVLHLVWYSWYYKFSLSCYLALVSTFRIERVERGKQGKLRMPFLKCHSCFYSYQTYLSYF